MEAISITCNRCGAPLEIGRGVRFLTCNYCGSRLQVHQTDSATFTEVLETIQEHTSQMAEDVGVIRLQNEVEQLDRQWAIERESYLTHGKNGTTTEPGMGGAGVVVGGLFVAFFVAVAVAMGVSAVGFANRWPGPGGPGALALVPFGMAILAVVGFLYTVVSSRQKAEQYAAKKRVYDERRAKLLAEIARRQPPHEPPTNR